MPPRSGNLTPLGKAPISLSFSGSGFLAVYQLGVVQCLLDVVPGVVQRAPKVFGASAGSLAAAAVVCGANMGRVRDEMLKFATSTRGHLLGPLHPSVDVFQGIERVLRRVLPENAHQLASGRLHVAVTRISDGKNILISEFQSKQDVIQALLCSCFVPMYCGLMPPSYKGEYYVDGGFTSIQPAHDHNRTLTVSPFAGEVDICPRDQMADYYVLIVSGFAFHLTQFNFFRMLNALFPPPCAVLEKAYSSGYQDALLFLQKSDLIEYLPYPMNSLLSAEILSSKNEMDRQALWETEEEEEHKKEEDEGPVAAQEEASGIVGDFSHSSDSLPWSLTSLEQALYLSLPAWVRTALLCNLMAEMGLVSFQNMFLVRLISYLLLPYMLPACILSHLTYRLFLRLKRIPEDAYWLWQDTKQIVLFFFNITMSSLRKNLADRFLPSLQLSSVMQFLSDCDGPTELPQLRRRSTLRIQLSTANSSPDPQPRSSLDALAFAFMLDLELEMDSHPDSEALPPLQQPQDVPALPRPEGELEAPTNTANTTSTSSSHDSFLQGEEAEEGREQEGGSRNVV